MKRLLVLLALGAALAVPGIAQADSVCTAAGVGYPAISLNTPGISAAGYSVAPNGVRVTGPVNVSLPVACAPVP